MRCHKLLGYGAGAFVLLCIGGSGCIYMYSQHQQEVVARAMTGGDPSRAPDLIRRYGCAGCHTIPGIPGGDGQVGGSLAGLRQRVYVGGAVTNSPENLTRWIVAPQSFAPRTAMPASGISESEARDVAAFLYTR